MKRWVVCLCMMLMIAAQASALTPKPATMSVQVKNGQIRGTPSFLGAIVAPVAYGDRVNVVSEQGEWMKVATEQGKEGWIHGSALTKKRIVLQAGDKDVAGAASGDELALAGKGFSSEVEGKFKAANKDIDFAWVDRMEKWKVDVKEMQKFLKEGDVTPAEGGAR